MKKNLPVIPKINEKISPVVTQGNVTEVIEKKGFSWFDKRRLRKKPEESYVVTLLFSNGTMRSWVVTTTQETFIYKKKAYYLRYEDSYYDLTQRQYHLLFSEDCSVPISREIVMTGDQAVFKVTPENLKPLLEMNMLKALINSTEFNKFLRIGMLVGVANLFLLIITIFMIYRIK